MELIADPLGRETGGHAHGGVGPGWARTGGGVDEQGTHGWKGGEGEAARADERMGWGRTGGEVEAEEYLSPLRLHRQDR